MAEQLLAEREVAGFPGVSVELHMDLAKTPPATRVVIKDAEGEQEFSDPDAYLHPFVFGYIVPEYHNGD